MKALRLALALTAAVVTFGAALPVLYLGDVPLYLAVLFAGSCAAAMAWPGDRRRPSHGS